jgi:hypothetical protein
MRGPSGRKAEYYADHQRNERRVELMLSDFTLSTSSCSSLSSESRASRYSLLSFGYRSSLIFASSLKLVSGYGT